MYFTKIHYATPTYSIISCFLQSYSEINIILHNLLEYCKTILDTYVDYKNEISTTFNSLLHQGDKNLWYFFAAYVGC
jgi:hypothetical protein